MNKAARDVLRCLLMTFVLCGVAAAMGVESWAFIAANTIGWGVAESLAPVTGRRQR